MDDPWQSPRFLEGLSVAMTPDDACKCLCYLFLHKAQRCLGPQGMGCQCMCSAIYQSLPEGCRAEVDKAVDMDSAVRNGAPCGMAAAAQCLHAQSVYLLAHMTDCGLSSQCGDLFRLVDALCNTKSPYLTGSIVESDNKLYAERIVDALHQGCDLGSEAAWHGADDCDRVSEVVRHMELLRSDDRCSCDDGVDVGC